jgi:bacteriorhodopsin
MLYGDAPGSESLWMACAGIAIYAAVFPFIMAWLATRSPRKLWRFLAALPVVVSWLYIGWLLGIY